MRETFQHRQKLVNDPGRSVDILSSFPRFLDTEGLVDQDFPLLFDDDTSSRLLQIWDLSFEPNVMEEAKRLTSTPELRRLVQSAESPPGSDLDDATKHLRNQPGQQPYLLAVGRQKSKIDRFYITMDKRLIPCKANRSLGAFDELFKAHFVFNLSYDVALVNFYTFLQTTVYNIDVGKMKESPRVKDLRARLLNQPVALSP
ncbi:hypothetical protein FQN60_004966, partial [Etheostoma spectabile]